MTIVRDSFHNVFVPYEIDGNITSDSMCYENSECEHPSNGQRQSLWDSREYLKLCEKITFRICHTYISSTGLFTSKFNVIESLISFPYFK